MANFNQEYIASGYAADTTNGATRIGAWVEQSVDAVNRRVTVTVHAEACYYRIGGGDWYGYAGTLMVETGDYNMVVKIKKSSDSTWSSNSSNGYGMSFAYAYSAVVGQTYTYKAGRIGSAAGRSPHFTYQKTFDYDDDGTAIPVNFSVTLRDMEVTGTVTTSSISSKYTAPSVPTISLNSKTATSATFDVALTSYGVPSNADGRYIEAGICSTSGDYVNLSKRYNTATNVTSATITVNNANSGNLAIVSNTKYYYGAYATNTQKNSYIADISANTFFTSPAAPTATNFSVVDAGTAYFTITDVSDGTAKRVQLQYRYKSSTGSYSEWTNAGTAWNHQIRTVQLSGLDSNTNYTVQVRAINNETTPAVSDVSTYDNAFKTLKVTCNIVSEQDSESQTAGKVDSLIAVSFSTAVTNPLYDYEYGYKKEGASTWTTGTGVSTDPLTPVAAITLTALDPKNIYNFRIRARIHGGEDEPYGDYTTLDFVTPSFSPEQPTVTYSFNDNRTIMYVTVTPNGNVSSLSLKVTPSTSTWTTIFNNTITTTSATTFSVPLKISGNYFTPKDYAALRLTATQKYGSASATTTTTVNTPWRIIGLIKLPDGTTKNIVGVKVKNGSGNISTGNKNTPFVIK